MKIFPSNEAISAAKKIKAATTESHRHIEDAVPVLRPDFSRNDYIVLIKKFYGFHSPLESVLLKSPLIEELKIGYATKRLKVHCLISDLKHLGISEQDIESLPLIQLWFKNAGLAEILGILYVIEGSTLGGAVITQKISQSLQLVNCKGASFFSSYGKLVGPNWLEFLEILNSNLSSEKDIRIAIDAANATFVHFGTWIKS